MRVSDFLVRFARPPAQVSEQSLRSLRQRGIGVLIWLGFWACYMMFMLLVAGGAAGSPSVVHTQVTKVYGAHTIEPPAFPYGIRAADGGYYYFGQDPGLHPGDPLTLHYDSRSYLTEIDYPGGKATVAHSSQPTTISRLLLILLVGLVVLLALCVFGGHVAFSRRFKADLAGATPVTRRLRLNKPLPQTRGLFGLGFAASFQANLSRPVTFVDPASNEKVRLLIGVGDYRTLVAANIAPSQDLEISYYPNTHIVSALVLPDGQPMQMLPVFGDGLRPSWSAQWFLLRNGFRAGPGEISERALRLLKLRIKIVLPIYALLLAIPLVVGLIFAPLVVPGPEHRTDLTVAGVFDHDLGSSLWSVRASDGLVYNFHRDPQLSQGDHFQVIRNSRGFFEGTVINGNEDSAEGMTPEHVELTLIVVFAALLVMVAATLFPLARIYRMAKSVEADLHASPITEQLKPLDLPSKPLGMNLLLASTTGMPYRFETTGGEARRLYVAFTAIDTLVHFVQDHPADHYEISYSPNAHCVLSIASGAESVSLNAPAGA